MTWIGWDDWAAPDPYIDVATPVPAWESPTSVVIFFVARTRGDSTRTFRAYAQRNALSNTGKLTPEASEGDGIHLIQEMDERNGWIIGSVETLSSGGFAAHVVKENSNSA